MGNRYGDAWIDLLYGINTEVRETNPAKEAKKQGIRPERYLVLPGTETIFPGGIFINWVELKEFEGYNWEPKTVIKSGRPDRCYPKHELTPLDNAEIGSVYPVTLVKRIIHLDSELERKGIARVDSFNYLVFECGGLEKRLIDSKRRFKAMLETAGLNCDPKGIYFRLVTFPEMF